EVAFDIRYDVHYLTVALNEELVGHVDRADARDAADVVATEIEQHQVLGSLLGIGEQFLFQRLVLMRRLTAPPCTGDWADGDGVAAHAHENFGAGARNREAAVIEEKQEWRRIDPPKSAI